MWVLGRAGPGLVWTDSFAHLGGLCRAQYATMLADAATQIEALQERFHPRAGWPPSVCTCPGLPACRLRVPLPRSCLDTCHLICRRAPRSRTPRSAWRRADAPSLKRRCVSPIYMRPYTNQQSEPCRIDEAAHDPTLPPRHRPRGPCSALHVARCAGEPAAGADHHGAAGACGGGRAGVSAARPSLRMLTVAPSLICMVSTPPS